MILASADATVPEGDRLHCNAFQKVASKVYVPSLARNPPSSGRATCSLDIGGNIGVAAENTSVLSVVSYVRRNGCLVQVSVILYKIQDSVQSRWVAISGGRFCMVGFV